MIDSAADGEIRAVEERAVAAARLAFGDGWQLDRVALAPGRIELLGNHLDYNGGPVLCAAIDRHVAVAAGGGPAGGWDLRVVAADNPTLGVVAFDAESVRDWRNPERPPNTDAYVRGLVAGALDRPNLSLRRPTELAIAGDVPLGFGLSSSAALCVSLGLAMVEPRPSDHDLVLLAQEAEHRAGTPCGTMDQSASVAGGVIRFDGATLTIERLSPDLGELVFAVVDSGVERSLGVSSYPLRVEESRAALDHANRVLGLALPHLAALSIEALEELTTGTDPLPSPLLDRVRHVVSETLRVNQGEAALGAADWPRFGALMTASGRSSATDYAISHPKVEELVGETLQAAGVLGARMMGGGEGGAVLVLLPRDFVGQLEATLRHGFFARHGMTERSGLVHACAFSDGARVRPVG
ncbi:MAG: Galactokinase [uncultured Thermomicrobiales bacterium]|uniref:Galactokinase n=1 Tax=uncultured Thermomicrobiales bacterium TaxID=1645740 RepID=A0A6J4TZR8_9BACT|nr:MAG: Galactokinase [uncultured Thermomicrobiales bacterium]